MRNKNIFHISIDFKELSPYPSMSREGEKPMPIKGKPEGAEETALIPIPEQQTFFVAKSNELIQQSRFSMTVQQNKIMLYLISKIKPMDIGDEVYSVSIREFCKVCNIDYNSGKNYADAKKAIKAIADKSVWVKQEDGSEVLLRWLNRVKLNRETNCFEITFHEDMLPYLYDLQSRYTRYCFNNVLTMKSKYGIRLYELLKSYQFMKKEISFTIEELKKRLDAEGYKRYPDFRRFVLEKAIEDINECSDIEVSYTPYSSSNKRGTNYITFTIKEPSYLEDKLRKTRKKRKLTPSGKSEYKRRVKAYEARVKKEEENSQS